MINPRAGWVANANNDPIGTSNDNDPLNQERRGGQGILYLGISYDRGYRIGQIERLLEAELAGGGKFSVEDFERIQANNQLLDAQVFVPHILDAFQRAGLASDTLGPGRAGSRSPHRGGGGASRRLGLQHAHRASTPGTTPWTTLRTSARRAPPR